MGWGDSGALLEHLMFLMKIILEANIPVIGTWVCVYLSIVLKFGNLPPFFFFFFKDQQCTLEMVFKPDCSYMWNFKKCFRFLGLLCLYSVFRGGTQK